MFSSRVFAALSLLLVAFGFSISGGAWSAPFTPGNLVVYRIGTGGAATLVATGNPVILDEYTTAGALVQSVPMPTAASGANNPFAASGTATSDGLLSRSVDGKCLAVPGYGRDPALTSGNLTSTAGIARVVGRVSADGSIDTSTALTDAATGGNFRGAASLDCTGFWTSGSVGGARYATIGATTSTSLTPSLSGARSLAVFNGQLYLSSNIGTNTFKGVSTLGSGTPTTGSPSITRLPGLTDTNSPSTYGFFLADLSAGVAGLDTLYVADDAAGALSKFSLVGGTWTLNGTIGVAADSYRGLTGVVSGGTVTLYATRKNGELVLLVDSSGYNGAFSGAPTLLATAAANTAFRGVAWAPELKFNVASTAGANGTISPSSTQMVYSGASTSFTVTPDAGYTAIVGGTCGGTLVGTTYTTSAIVADCTVSASFTTLPTFNVTPSATGGGTISPSTVQTVLSGGTRSFTITPAAGYTMSVDGTCGGTLAGNTYTTNAIGADCTVDAAFTPITYTVTPSAGANGSISPSVPQTVNSGATTVFTLTPAAGYAAAAGGTCGGTLAGNTYTTNSITGNCTVTASFTALPTFVVTPSAGANGSITPATPQTVVEGATTSFTVTPAAGYFAAMRGTCGGTLSGNTFTTNAITAACTVSATFSKKLVLFIGNSYTFGRIDPVMSYNAANVTDLTAAMWLANPTGTNPDEPHPWGGIPGVFKKLTDQAGLQYDVSISARNAASLRGHFINASGWDLRGNAASQKWNTVVLQDLSDEPLPAGRSSNANLPYFNAYADKFEAWVHTGAAQTYTETDLFGAGSAATCASVTGASTGTCNTVRTIAPANPNASTATDVYLYQTWARPDLIAPNGTQVNGTTYSAAEGLETMTADFHNSYFGRAAANPNYKAVSPVGDAFLRAVTSGVAMRDPYVPEAGKINLWHTDFYHPSKYGSYLSALVHFAMISGLDPTTLGAGELAAIDLGISAADAVALQQVAKATVVPAAPAIGSVSAAASQVTVSFTPASNVGGLAITGYTATCGAQNSSGASSPIVVSGLANGSAVSCTVSASNSVGAGASSSSSASVTPVAAPGAPIIGNATAGDRQVTVSFTAPAANGSAITGYAVTSHPAGGVDSNAGSTGLSHVVTGLLNGTTYTFTVAATNAIGTGAASSASNGVTPSGIQTPQIQLPICTLNATPAKITAGGFSVLSVSCNPSATSYAWSNAGFGTNTSGGTVTPTASATYSVVGSNADGTGNIANVRVAVLPTCTLSASAKTILPGASATLGVSCTPAATSYTWTNSGFSSTANGGNVTPAATTVYTVVGSNADGDSVAASVTVAVAKPVDVRSYVPAAAAATGYMSFLRVINSGADATPVLVARIDGASGSVGAAGQLSASLAAGAAQTFSAQQIEAALGVSLPASDRPRIRVAGAQSNLEVQSFLLQPGAVYSDVTGAQSGTAVAVSTYVPAAAAGNGYVSQLRVINTGNQATSVRVARIDAVSGQSGSAATLNASLPAGAAITYSAEQLEAALGAPIASSERPRILLTSSGALLDVQSFLLQPGGAYVEVSSARSGYSVDVPSYVPAAAQAYTSFLRIINGGGTVTPVTATVIDGATGAALATGTLIAALPGGAAVTLSSSQIESALGVALPAGSRPRIRVNSAGIVASVLQVQSFLLQPGGAYNEISNAIRGATTNVRTYLPAADAAAGYVSYLRVINPGSGATPVTVALIDEVTGAAGEAHTLLASLPGGGAQTFSSSMIEAALGRPVAAGTRPRIQVAGNAELEVQSFLTQPGGAFTEVSGQ